MSSRVVVFGSCNKDMIVYAPRFPKPGETMYGNNFKTCFGGKAANQAVMAGKLFQTSVSAGSSSMPGVSLICCIGDDAIGKETITNLQSNGVSSKFAYTAKPGVASGIAQITVSAGDGGDNHIVIVGGANMELTDMQLEKCLPEILESDMFICQLEQPVERNEYILKRIWEERGSSNDRKAVLSMLNTAPVPPQESDRARVRNLLQYVDIVCPNEVELQMLAEVDDTSTQEKAEAACKKIFTNGGVRFVVATQGSRGCLITDRDGNVRFVAATKVDAVDTTGAGDCFIGAFSYKYSELVKTSPLSLDLIEQCAKFGCAAATISVTRIGVQDAQPKLEEIKV